MFQALYVQRMLVGEPETTVAGNPKPPLPEVYLELALEDWYDGVTKYYVINSFKEGSGIPNGLYELNKAREAAEAQELAEILARFEIEGPDKDEKWAREQRRSLYDERAASVR